MKLPYYKNAFIPKEKLEDYLLSETHPVGSAKARYFFSLGFNKTNSKDLMVLFLKLAQENEVKDTKKIPYGTNFVIEGIIETANGKRSMIATVWFIESGKNKPRFITAYPV